MSLFKYFIRNMISRLQPHGQYMQYCIDMDKTSSLNSNKKSTTQTREISDFKNTEMNPEQDLVWIDMEVNIYI